MTADVQGKTRDLLLFTHRFRRIGGDRRVIHFRIHDYVDQYGKRKWSCDEYAGSKLLSSKAYEAKVEAIKHALGEGAVHAEAVT